MNLIKQKNRIYTLIDKNGLLLPFIIAKKHNNYYEMKKEVDRLEIIKDIPGVVRIISFKRNLIFLEKIDGDDLSDILDKRKKLFEYEVRHITKCLLKIVHSLHTIGIIHGDIKPENIMYNEITKKVTLIDFEYSRHTNNYASPEVLERNYKTSASDIWSIGVTIYTLLMGYNPYNNKSDLLSGVSMHPMDPHISGQARDFIIECLNIDYFTRLSIIECMNHPYVYKQYKSKTRNVCKPRSFSLDTNPFTNIKDNVSKVVIEKSYESDHLFSCCLIC